MPTDAGRQPENDIGSLRATVRKQRWRLASRRLVRLTDQGASESFEQNTHALKAIRSLTNEAVRGRVRGDPRAFRQALRRSVHLAVPRVATPIFHDVADTISSVDRDPASFPDLSADLIARLDRLDPASASGNEWLRLRYVLAAHGFIEASATARSLARTAAIGRARSGRATGDALAVAAALSLDAGDVDTAQLAVDELTSRFPSSRARGQLPTFVAIATGDDATVREHARARRREQDRLMFDLVRDRSVALVGPAPTTTRHGEEIDAHDIVVRLTYVGPDSIGDPETAGRRTDISYYNKPLFYSDKTPGPDSRPSSLPADLRCAVMEANPSGDLGTPARRGFRPQAPGVLGIRPDKCQKIQFAIFDLLHFEPARIKVFNTSFYWSSELYHEGFTSGRAVKNSAMHLCKQFSRHDPLGNRNFVRHVLAGHEIEMDEKSAKIVALSDTDYSRGLDRLFGAGHWPRSYKNKLWMEE